MKKKLTMMLMAGSLVIPVLVACAVDSSASKSPPQDADTDQDLNPADAEAQRDPALDRTTEKWLEDTRQKSRLDRHR